ncbi:hypothetical protein AB670_01596 [Chryseobacterium sp. MOF25P]|uniref:hypothetical protein n=1 Tax=unclassified Chryseobacterium TaxID=2593645 RepID=UPI000805A38F|nr:MULTISPECIES: hypothetical protein [unclassified Chryseobacterium]OBW42015.1 hypothetical protein AB670_01596 [Chryseobacterium sp. MOF25P]OBW44120.1 hypothetical protein AB671_03767 [Chryseobacterium sp. BGARF1]
MRKHKKIYYVAGIISALLVPLLFIYHATPVYDQVNMRVLDIGLPYKAKKGEKIPEYTQIPKEGWNCKTINVKPDFDAITEKNFIKEIDQLVENDIDQTGIRFQLSDKNVYADIIGLLNIMLKTKQEMYGLDMDETNSLYVLYKKPLKIVEYTMCGTDEHMMYSNMNQYNYANANFWNKLIYYSPKESYYLIFGFLMLIYCAMLRPKLSFKI